MKYQAILFDLDGTLLDTVPGLARSMNEVLAKHNFPEHSIEEYKNFIGNGVFALVEQSAPIGTSPEMLEILYREKSALYEEYWKTGSFLFSGIAEMLYSIESLNMPKAIFSNKEDHYTQAIVATMFAKWHFIAVRGRTDGIPKKPDPTGPLAIINTTNIPTTAWLHVGDKEADSQVAQAIGCGFAWAKWGYQIEAPIGAVVLDTPQAILPALQ